MVNESERLLRWNRGRHRGQPTAKQDRRECSHRPAQAGPEGQRGRRELGRNQSGTTAMEQPLINESHRDTEAHRTHGGTAAFDRAQPDRRRVGNAGSHSAAPCLRGPLASSLHRVTATLRRRHSVWLDLHKAAPSRGRWCSPRMKQVVVEFQYRDEFTGFVSTSSADHDFPTLSAEARRLLAPSLELIDQRFPRP